MSSAISSQVPGAEPAPALSPAPPPAPAPARKLSRQLRALLAIVQANPELERMMMPHISLETEAVHWEKIYPLALSSGQEAVITWCFNIWTDRYRPRVNSFDAVLCLDDKFKRAILQALGLRWGLLD